MRRRVLMIKTEVGFAYLLILALLGLFALAGGVVMLVRLIRRLGSMSHDDLERLARQSPKSLKKRNRPASLDVSLLGSMQWRFFDSYTEPSGFDSLQRPHRNATRLFSHLLSSMGSTAVQDTQLARAYTP